MLFDDRLATVLRSPPGGDAAVRTQYRQLVDLLGSRQAGTGELTVARYRALAIRAAALPPAEYARIVERPAFEARNPALLAWLGWQRLERLGERIPADERSRILREPGQRLRNPQLVAFLAEGEPRVAAAAVATAQLEEDEWLALVPRLPVIARGFLRHRRDLPPRVRDLLASLGVEDLALPLPAGIALEPEDPAVAPPLTPSSPAETAPAPGADKDGIRALLRRIEAFREGREGREGRRLPGADARLPLGDMAVDDSEPAITQFDLLTGPDLRIAWTETEIAPLLVGMRLGPEAPGTLAVLRPAAAESVALRLPLAGVPLAIAAAPAVSGDWLLWAEPVFAPGTGQFAGYRGRAIRAPAASAPASAIAATGADPAADTPGERMRQALHELRTPVNAIQGFAEIIQQQIFGPAPNAYRALAAAVAVDAARLLAAFEEIDRLARLETGALALAEGDGDLREAVVDTIRRLDGVLRPRGAAVTLAVSGSPFTTALAREEVLVLCWRVLATLAGVLSPGETIAVRLSGNGQTITLDCQLPAAIAALEDRLASPRQERLPAVSAGMFGSGFSLRLAGAEAQAAGGGMEICADNLVLTLPVLTGAGAAHSVG